MVGLFGLLPLAKLESAMAFMSSSSSLSRQSRRPTLGWLDLARTAPFDLERQTTAGKRLELRKQAIFFSWSSVILAGTITVSG